MLMLHAIRSLLGGSYRGPPRARSDDMGKNKGNVRFATGPGRSQWPGHGVRPCRTGVRDHPVATDGATCALVDTLLVASGRHARFVTQLGDGID